MAEVKRALVEVPGLPYRVLSVADEQEARDAFAHAFNVYLHNHAEDARYTHRYFRGYQIVHTNDTRWISAADIQELAPLVGETRESMSHLIPMQCALNRLRAQAEKIERLMALLAEVSVTVDEFGFKRP